MPSFSFIVWMALLAFGLLSPIFFVIRRFRRPEAHSAQRTAILSLCCFLGGTLLYFQFACWRAEARYEASIASYESIQRDAKTSQVELPNALLPALAASVESNKKEIVASQKLRNAATPDLILLFLGYYVVLSALAWTARRLMPMEHAETLMKPIEDAPEADQPTIIGRLCLVLILAIGISDLGIALFASIDEHVPKELIQWVLCTVAAPLVICVLYYVAKGIPRGPDRLFAKRVLGPTLFWCLLPAVSFFLRLILIGTNRHS
jgi:hypothetical protein